MTGDPLIDVALKLADGTRVDWERVVRDVAPIDRPPLERLRQLQAVGQLHAGNRPDAPMVLETLQLAPGGDDAEPLKWGSLDILTKIGRGAYGDVYRARDRRLGRDVALKLLRHRDDAAAESEVVREGHLLARVRHPNVVTVYGAERIDGRTGLWMELLQGETLEAELRRRGPFPADELVKVATDLCNAVEAVHRAGLLHRDIKAQNVIRADDGRLVLMDFGTGSEGGVATAGLAGTPAYLAPEVLAGSAPTVASEVYAVGVLLFHLATGVFPVPASDLASLRLAHLEHRRQRLVTTRPDLPDHLSSSIDRALDSDPSQRFATIAAFRTSMTPAASRESWLTRRFTITAAAIGGALVAIAAAVNQWGPDRPATPAAITLSQVPFSFQRQFNIRAPSWEGSLVTCSPTGLRSVSLCDVREGRIVRHLRSPASPNEGSTIAFMSPDGRHVAYWWLTGRQSSIRIVDAVGANDRELLSGDAVPGLMGWNNASTKLFLGSVGDDTHCAELMDIRTRVRERVRCVSGDSSMAFPALSADERFLAYVAPQTRGGPAEDIWIFDRVSGTQNPVTSDNTIDVFPLWSPDGRHLVFTSNRLGTWGIFSMPVERGKAVGAPVLVRDVGRSMPVLLGFTRMGSLFLRVFTALEDVLLLRPDWPRGSLGTLARAELTALDESNRSPDWSPDGQRFAYIAGEWRGNARIAIARAQGGIVNSLSFPLATRFGRVRWSPDGLSLAVTAPHDTNPNSSTLDLIDLRTGDRRPLVVTERIVDLRWAPDGRAIYILSRGAIHRVDVKDGSTRLVYRPEKPMAIEPASTFDLSRDGTTLLVAVRSTPEIGVKCLARIVTISRGFRDLPPFPDNCRAIAWTHDEGAVLAGVHADDDQIPLFMVPVQGGEPPVRLVSPPIQVVDISTSPDGTQLLIGSGNPRPDVWTLSGFAPAIR